MKAHYLTGGGFLIGAFLVAYFVWIWLILPSPEVHLIIAARNDGTNSIEKLVRQGVDVNAQVGEKGLTALMVAASNGNVNSVRLLLRYGADPDLKNKDGYTALDLAVASSRHEVVKELESFRKKHEAQ